MEGRKSFCWYHSADILVLKSIARQNSNTFFFLQAAAREFPSIGKGNNEREANPASKTWAMKGCWNGSQESCCGGKG